LLSNHKTSLLTWYTNLLIIFCVNLITNKLTEMQSLHTSSIILHVYSIRHALKWDTFRCIAYLRYMLLLSMQPFIKFSWNTIFLNIRLLGERWDLFYTCPTVILSLFGFIFDFFFPEGPTSLGTKFWSWELLESRYHL